MNSIGFIGGGRVTRIILQAWNHRNMLNQAIKVFDPNPDALTKLTDQFPKAVTFPLLHADILACDVIFLAVHPPVMPEILSQLRGKLAAATILVSLAPKWTLEATNNALDGFDNLARVNPSAVSVINQGINPVCFSAAMPEPHRQVIRSLLEPLGNSPEIEETKLEAYAMINAMGPTYFWFQMQILKDLAMKYGMTEEEAVAVIPDMLQGASDTLFHSGLSVSQVFDLVPVKPLGAVEETIKGFYTEKLDLIFDKIKP
jgi:pyrroline-5-carboxylate reductase